MRRTISRVELTWPANDRGLPHYRVLTDFGLAFDFYPDDYNGRMLSPCCRVGLMMMNDEPSSGTLPEYSTCTYCRRYTRVPNRLHRELAGRLEEPALEAMASVLVDPLEAILLGQELTHLITDLAALPLKRLTKKESRWVRWTHRATLGELSRFEGRVLA